MRKSILFAFIFSLQMGFAQENLNDDVNQLTEEFYPEIFEVYKSLHQNPEISFYEVETAAFLAEELRKLGFEVTENVGGNGIVGIFENGEGPKVMIRADMDALPVEEKTGATYASTKQVQDDAGNTVYAMHACGHDVHMSSWLGTAKILTSLKDKWSGTLMFIGQPAEERSGGAIAMLREDLFSQFLTPDYALALHVSASLPAGKVSYTEGYALANVDAVDITIYGVGGHGAYPHTTIDPIVLGSRIVMALQTIVSREIAPTDPAVVTVGSFHAGTKHNVIPESAHLQLTLRSYTDEVREQTIEAIRRIVKYEALSAGMPEDKLPLVEIKAEYTPATYNDLTLTRRVAKVFQGLVGEANVVKGSPVMGGEDFGRYGRTEEDVPICIFWLGAVEASKYEASIQNSTPLPSLHSSLFLPDPKPTLKTGMRSMSAAALDLLLNE